MLQCAMVIVGGRQALWVVVAVGEHGDVVLVGIVDDGKSSVGICRHLFGKVDARMTYIK